LSRPNAHQTKDFSEFKLNEVLSNDGSYTIELALDGRPYSTYKLNVKNGRLNDFDLAQMRKERYRIVVPLTAAIANR
jgi:hypothetical protein